MARDEKIVSLERQVMEVRRAAVKILTNLVEGAITSSKEREMMARSLEIDAEGADEETARLGRLLANALRTCDSKI